MNVSVKNIELADQVFTANDRNFDSLALDVFRFQHEHNPVYRLYCDNLKIDAGKIGRIESIPFLPIGFFKTHRVITTEFNPEVVFESSGTTQTTNSRHYVKDTGLYKQSFHNAFKFFYGEPAEWCIIALLPSYLERNNSSLVLMADNLIQQSDHPESGFYLNELEKLSTVLQGLEKKGQKTLLIGVSFALLDLAEQYPMQLKFTTVMETGGMKGRRQEMVRQQLHEILCSAFSIDRVHSEYGMTELLSQAYSAGQGIFHCPAWLKVMVREEDDPLAVQVSGDQSILTGALNIIDLANIYSCSFIATDDACKLYPGGSFEVLGRLDNSDIRGCSLLAL